MKTGFQYIDGEEIPVEGISSLLLIGDPGCTGFYEDSRKILGQLLEHRKDFIFFLGDLTFIGTEEEFQEIIEFCNSRVRVPIFSLCGNHDIPYYNMFLGLTSYALVLGPFVCLFLSNPTGYFPVRDLEFLAASLEKHRGKNFIILMHIPPPTDVGRGHMPLTEWEKLRTVLDPHRQKIAGIFCAHIHGFHEFSLDGYKIIITAGGGSAMIHELKKPGRRIHHAIAVNLHPNGRVNTELLIAEDGSTSE